MPEEGSGFKVGMGERVVSCKFSVSEKRKASAETLRTQKFAEKRDDCSSGL